MLQIKRKTPNEQPAQNTACSGGSCKTSNLCWGILGPNGRLHRATFSKSLAECILTYDRYKDYSLTRLAYRRGAKLEPGEKSHAVYGVIATKKNRVLRIPLTRESAEIYTECNSRHIEEIYLNQIGE